jgi:RND family efflux transporter MFP subunit
MEGMMERLPALYELATAYHACRDLDSLLRTFSTVVRARLGARGVLLWLPENGTSALRCRGKYFAPGERFEPAAQTVDSGFLAEVLAAKSARRLASADKKDRLLGHLVAGHRERVESALYAPIPSPAGPAGVVEVLNKEGGEFTAEDAGFLEEAARMTGRVMDTLHAADEDRHSQLSTVERLTSLYDISRIFNSTLEIENLCPIITAKIRDLLGAGAANLWLVSGDGAELLFAHQDGEDPTTTEDGKLALGEGFLGAVASSGQERLVAKAAEEPLLAERRQSGEFTLRTAMAAPLVHEDKVIGVIEVVNKLDGTPFDEDDLFFLTSISEQARMALHNAKLLDSERRVHELDALLAISKEITSTLDLDHVLSTVVHQAATVVPFERCAIGLYDRDRFELVAVSGETEVPRTPEMKRLGQLLEWVAGQSEPVSADRHEEIWKTSPEKPSPLLIAYLEQERRNGFYALPLRDEQGILGVLALESGDSEFLGENQLETLSILANQVTVAIRNARLYQSVPLMRVLRPMAKTREKLGAVGRKTELLVKIGAVAVLLVVVPWPFRVSGTAGIVPAERRLVTAEVEGVVRQVFVHEGEVVAAGAPLAQLDDAETRVRLERAQARLALARHDLAEAGDRRDFSTAAQARLHMDIEQAEVDFDSQMLARSRLVAPISGIVVTPKVEEKTGRFLARGDNFCEMVDNERMAADIEVIETDTALLQPDAPVDLKLNAYPTVTFRGTIDRVGTRTVASESEQYFFARAIFPNTGGRLRTGMVGLAKVTAVGGWFQSGWYPSGYVLLRSPVRWLWRKIWSWLP